MVVRALAALTALAALSACGSATDSGAEGETPATGAPAPSSPSAPAGSEGPTAPAGQVVRLTRTGGLIGSQDVVVVTAADDGTGTATVTSRRAAPRTEPLTAGAVADLRREVESAKSSSPSASYPPRPGLADAFQYELDLGGRVVLLHEHAVPPALQPLVQDLVALLAR